MRVTLADRRLNGIVSSSVSLEATWPEEAERIRTLLAVLECSEPSLAEALLTGLFGPLRIDGDMLVIEYGLIAAAGFPARKFGGRRLSPHTPPREIACFELVDIAVAGQSWIKMAG